MNEAMHAVPTINYGSVMASLTDKAPEIWDIDRHLDSLRKLLSNEIIGFYRSFEVTEIIGFHGRNTKPVNFLSILVAEPLAPPIDVQTTFLNAQPLHLPGTQWKFGINRYRISIDQAFDTLGRYASDAIWNPTGIALTVGQLVAVPTQFVPSDGRDSHCWNDVLKNNFWAGSHVIELFDREKSDVKFLLEDVSLLSELAAKLRPFVNIDIDGLSDRLGNVLFQLPVTVLTVSAFSDDTDGAFIVQPIWHPSATPRKLRVSCEKFEDTTVEGFDSKEVNTEQARFNIRSLGGNARYILWDDANEIILSASATTAFFTSFGWSFNSTTIDGNARTFSLPTEDGKLEPTWIPVSPPHQFHVQGRTHLNPREPWRSERVFRHSLRRQEILKEFVQYGGATNVSREEAIQDIRWLIREHGKIGVWLWDPFLSAGDVLLTLFYNGHTNSDQRALTDGREPPQSRKNISAGQTWVDVQRKKLEEAKGNVFGLNLEYRIRRGHGGWEFHDRFLIFPMENGGALAWSLGTSINGFGKSHHILQKVDDGTRISLAFLDLWKILNRPEHLIWKTS